MHRDMEQKWNNFGGNISWYIVVRFTAVKYEKLAIDNQHVEVLVRHSIVFDPVRRFWFVQFVRAKCGQKSVANECRKTQWCKSEG